MGSLFPNPEPVRVLYIDDEMQIGSCDVLRDARPSSKQVGSRGKETRPPNLILRKRRNEVPKTAERAIHR